MMAIATWFAVAIFINALQRASERAFSGFTNFSFCLYKYARTKCIILHDECLNRLWHVDACVEALTYSEIQCLTATEQYQIPLLKDVILETSLPLMIDVKSEITVDFICDVLQATHAVSRALIVGGNAIAHQKARSRLPMVQLGLTWNELIQPSLEVIESCHYDYFNPPWSLLMEQDSEEPKLRSDTVAEMHNHGVRVSVWTVDDLETMWTLVNAGVDLIITNQVGSLTASYRRASQGTS